MCLLTCVHMCVKVNTLLSSSIVIVAVTTTVIIITIINNIIHLILAVHPFQTSWPTNLSGSAVSIYSELVLWALH